MPIARLSLFFLAGCALDNAIVDEPKDPVFDDGEAPGDTAPDTDTDTDSGGDTDSGDPVAECPPLDLGSAGPVAITEACAGEEAPEVTDPWDVVEEWSYTTGDSGVIVMPAVGNLTDDNGDGVVDEHDTPDIAFTVYGGERLVALHGDGSGVIVQRPMYSGSSGVAIADVDGDGAAEMIVNGWRYVVAVRPDGTELWRSPNVNVSLYTQPTVCDLDADGLPEVVMDGAVVNGEDGSLVTVLNTNALTFRAPVCADLDRDGEQEILLGNSAYHADGSVLWSSSGTDGETHAAVVQADGDEGGEAVFVSDGHAIFHDDDGSELLDVTLPSGGDPGPPCAADFDGDGEMELAVPGAGQLSLLEMDGTIVWGVPMVDGNGGVGCSGFDFDADGAWEIVVADPGSFRILDGATGDVRFEEVHYTQSLYEYPVVADIDGDGAAEVVVPENFGVRLGITVYGQADGTWPRSGPTWGIHDYATTNLNRDGSVPAAPSPSWLEGLFRARPSVDETGAGDLVVSILDVCVADCEAGPVAISVQVSNPGGEDLAAGAVLSVYADDGGPRRLVASTTLPAIAAGTALEGVEFELGIADLGAVGFVAVVDDGAAVRECDEANNEDTWADSICP